MHIIKKTNIIIQFNSVYVKLNSTEANFKVSTNRGKKKEHKMLLKKYKI
jgi:hypothetical protein